MSSIEQYLAQIAGARYGEEVRGSIVNAIRENYENVSTAKTIADDSATAADEAATRANTAASAAETVVEEADDIVKVSETEPVTQTTKLWFKPNTPEYQVVLVSDLVLAETPISGDDYELTIMWAEEET